MTKASLCGWASRAESWEAVCRGLPLEIHPAVAWAGEGQDRAGQGQGQPYGAVGCALPRIPALGVCGCALLVGAAGSPVEGKGPQARSPQGAAVATQGEPRAVEGKEIAFRSLVEVRLDGRHHEMPPPPLGQLLLKKPSSGVSRMWRDRARFVLLGMRVVPRGTPAGCPRHLNTEPPRPGRPTSRHPAKRTGNGEPNKGRIKSLQGGSLVPQDTSAPALALLKSRLKGRALGVPISITRLSPICEFAFNVLVLSSLAFALCCRTVFLPLRNIQGACTKGSALPSGKGDMTRLTDGSQTLQRPPLLQSRHQEAVRREVWRKSRHM